MQTTELQDIDVFTIGHGNRSIDTFISLLKQYNIAVVIDVRSIPYSRFHPQFRQMNLKASLANWGIDYLFLGKELGGRPSNPAMYVEGNANYDLMKETKEFKSGIEQVVELSKKGIKVTLMCSESDQNQCHRKHLISDELRVKGKKIAHINKTGSLERNVITTITQNCSSNQIVDGS